MPRITGINIPENKKVVISLTYIFGIGPSLSKKIVKKANIDQFKRTSELTDEELGKLRDIIEKEYEVEGELRRKRRESMDRLKRINCYRGVRHKKGLPAHGQNTRTNSRTVRGNVRKVAGSGKKAPASPK